ncbi:hypothetical protein HDV00_001500 [Rhizophlyctis rosea]|nr:hypothetical protein HDV00_001500 [Rhizophlyctis rosea]
MPAQPSSNIRSLSACPELVSQIISYLGEQILVRYDIPLYLALQRAIDTIWAKETTQLLQKPLQHFQAALALRDPQFVHENVCVFHNPLYVVAMTISDMGSVLNHAIAQDLPLKSFAKILLTYGNKTKLNPKRVWGPHYPFRSKKCVVRGRRGLDCKMDVGGCRYQLYEDIEHVDEIGRVIPFDFGVVREDEEDLYETIIVVSGQAKDGIEVTKARLVVEDGKVVDRQIAI